MPINISKYKETLESDNEGVWYPVPAYVLGLENEPNADRLDIEMQLRFYPDKVSRRHARNIIDFRDLIGGQRKRGKKMEEDVGEKLRELKYTYVVQDFKGFEMDVNILECNKENIILLLDIFPELTEWIDEIVEDINNYVEDKREEENENLETSSSSPE